MKKASLYLGAILIIMVTLSSAYYVSYKKTLEHYKSETAKIETDEIRVETSAIKGANQEDNESVTAADTIMKDKVLPGASYILITYDAAANTTEKKELSAPPEWIGLNRDELVKYLADYMKALPLEEIQQGLLAYDLESFSKNEVTVKKTYDSTSMPYEFYLGVENYQVVVYYCDKKTVFEYTGIDVRTLPDDEITRLVRGIYVIDKEELYGILENYSS